MNVHMVNDRHIQSGRNIIITNNSESGACINRRDLCTVVAPTLIEDVTNAVEYAEDNGWKEEKDAEKLKG